MLQLLMKFNILTFNSSTNDTQTVVEISHFANTGSSSGRVSAWEWEVMGSIPGCNILKSLKMVLVAPRLALRLMG